ncbi:MAG: 5'-nucleotidase C-terminal domain-containing protein [Lachnospiraceae bacterium]|nr:5'-nucleotidase C-terminal domain-containing protein [Lachnospiraceae bacterium]
MDFKSRIIAASMAVTVAFTAFGAYMPGADGLADVAEAGYEGEGVLQILSTTDLHGQSTAYNYNTASDRSKGSLAQIVTVVKSLKKGLKHGATLMVDSGDDVYGYGNENLMEGTTSGVEYLFEEMIAAGYDVITLGNHDFDYGYDYIQKELKDSGIKKKVVCANLYHAKTKKPVYPQSKIIYKTLTTTTGHRETVKIGVTGAIVPSLTTHYDWKDTLSTGDIVSTVRVQADALKAAGCDVVVVLAHSGVGGKNPKAGTDNVAYAISKIGSVDVICAGHGHENFPSSDDNVQKYYDYPGVNEATGLVNGKILVEEADHGRALGISRLRLSFTDGRATIVDRTVKVRKITSSDKQNAKIVKLNKQYDKNFASQNRKTIAGCDYLIANYFGMVEDLPLLQMVNEAKIAYGLRVIDEQLTEYRGYPVISATSYQVAGANGSEDYLSIDGGIKKSDLMKVQPTGQEKVKMYTITGKQLRETLEWEAASAYEKVGYSSEDDWSDGKMAALAGRGYNSVLNSTWLDKWAGLTVYDGIEYTIDLTQNPRYSISGRLIHSNSHRITEITYGGKKVKDDTVLILVSRNIATTTRNPIIGKAMKKQTILPKSEYLSEIFEEYFNDQIPDGTLHDYLVADENFILSCPAGDYVVKTSDTGEAYAAGNKSWYKEEIATTESGYGYYTISMGGDREDKSGPFLVAAPLKKKTTGNPVEVAVITSDKSGVDRVEYKEGICTNSPSDWSGSHTLNNNSGSFKAADNGWYSVRATDRVGNMNIRYVHIDNIDPNVSEAPTMDKFTNKMTKITGKASPGGEVIVAVGGGQYSATADKDGNYSVTVPYQKANVKIRVWQYDTQGRKSADTVAYVTRRGGNIPDVYRVDNKTPYIKGELSDSKYSSIVVIHNGNIYVPEQFVDYYKLSKLYSVNRYTLKRTSYKRLSDGTYKITIPYCNAGDSVRIYSVDWNGRLSAATNLTVEDKGPNVPKLGEFVVAEEGIITGKLNAPKEGTTYRAFVSVDGFRTYVDPEEDGRFMIDAGPVDKGSVVKVGVQDEVDGQWRTSAIQSMWALGMDSVSETADTGDVTFDELDDKMDIISGSVDDYIGDITLLLPNGRRTITVNEDGDFEFTCDSHLRKNTSVGVILRSDKHNIKIFGSAKVLEAAPEDPEWITEKITEDTTKVKFFDEDKDHAFLKVGGKVYKPAAVIESEARGGYVYVFKIKNPTKGAIVRGWLENSGGDTKRIKMTVKKGKKKKTEEEEALEALSQVQ